VERTAPDGLAINLTEELRPEMSVINRGYICDAEPKVSQQMFKRKRAGRACTVVRAANGCLLALFRSHPHVLINLSEGFVRGK